MEELQLNIFKIVFIILGIVAVYWIYLDHTEKTEQIKVVKENPVILSPLNRTENPIIQIREQTQYHTGDYGILFGILGFFIGGFIGYLNRPTVFYFRQLPLDIIITSWDSPLVQGSVNYIISGLILGTILGWVVGKVIKY